MSEIPNNMYVDVRWQVVKTIREYLLKHPDDSWARVQAFLLMDEPIIERDCGSDCQYGNSFFRLIVRLFAVN